MMKYFVLFASLLVVCFSKRVVLRHPLLNVDIVFTLKREERESKEATPKRQTLGLSRVVFKIRITNIPDDETYAALQWVVQWEDALKKFLDYLVHTCEEKPKSESFDKKWTVQVLGVLFDKNPRNLLGNFFC
eukprot:Platyproteum_vivax@DN7489_c0_g1_i2.p1